MNEGNEDMRNVQFISGSLLVYLLVILAVSSAGAQNENLLMADFDSHSPGPIGTGGPALGEPVAVVGCQPVVNVGGKLRIEDEATTSVSTAIFEFLDSAELMSDLLTISFTVYPANYNDYQISISEQGGTAYNFLTIDFESATQRIFYSDHNDAGPNHDIEWLIDPMNVVVEFNLNDGLYNVWWNDDLLIEDQAYGIPAHGIGRITFGCSDDPDLAGVFYVDNIEVHQVNITPIILSGWDREIIPRNAPDCTYNSCPVPTQLQGDINSTYINYSMHVDGGALFTTEYNDRIEIDGEIVYQNFGWNNNHFCNGDTGYVNLGPVTIRGGRHTLEFYADHFGRIDETSEFDNLIAYQWIWEPANLIESVPLELPAPYVALGGHIALPDGPRFDNCTGFRLEPEGWGLVSMFVDGPVADDYDLALFEPSTGTTDGFIYPLVNSERGSAQTELLIINGYTCPLIAYDLGIFNRTDGLSSYHLRYDQEQYAPLDTPISAHLAPDQAATIYRISFDAGQLGDYGIQAIVPPSDKPVTLACFAPGTEISNIGGALCSAAPTDPDRYTYLELDVTEAGDYALICYRDMNDYDDQLTELDIDLYITERRADLWAGYDADFPYSIWPSYEYQDPFEYPDSLVGDIEDIRFNFLFGNPTTTTLTSVPTKEMDILVDGEVINTRPIPGMAAGWLSHFSTTEMFSIRGGRHAVAMNLDSQGTYPEFNEHNNYTANTWHFLPSIILPLEQPVTLPEPVARTAGSNPDIGFTADNIDGVDLPDLTPVGDFGHWFAVGAYSPGAAAPAISIYQESDQTLAFSSDDELVTTQILTNTSNYVLAQLSEISGTDFYAGFTQAHDQAYAGEFSVCVTQSNTLPDDPVGPQGPYTLPANVPVAIHEVGISAGSRTITLENLSGNVNWGVSIHQGNPGIMGPGTGLIPNGRHNTNGPGEGESWVVNLPVSRYHCVVVWRAGNDDLSQAGEYQLTISSSSDVIEEVLLPENGLISNYPNPFFTRSTPQTTLLLKMADAGEADITIYDINGAAVRHIHHGHLSGGTHRLAWDGLNNQGVPTAAGLYLIEMKAGSSVSRHKITLVK